MSFINKSDFRNTTASFSSTSLTDRLNPTYSYSSNVTSSNYNKRKVQSVASSVFRNNPNEARTLKKIKVSNTDTSTSSKNYFLNNLSTSSSDTAAETQFIPTQDFSSSLNIHSDPAVGMQFIPAQGFSSHPINRDYPIVNSDGWCSFKPEIISTKILSQIKAGTLNVTQFFPNGFEITNEEWELLKPLLPTSIANLQYPRGLINKFIQYLLHERISNTSISMIKSVTYISENGEFISIALKNIKKDLYEIKHLICMYLTRFHGFLSTKYKINDYKSDINIKNSFNKNLDELVKNYFHFSKWKEINEILLDTYNGERKLPFLYVRLLVYLGVGAGFTNKLRNIHYNIRLEEVTDYLTLNTNIVSCLNDYIHKNCPKLKKYWMPHML